MTPPPPSSRRRAFSLAEVLLALAFFALCVVGLLVALGAGLGSVRGIQADYSTHVAVHNLQARFVTEPNWPGRASSYTFPINSQGIIVGPEDDPTGLVRLRRIVNRAWQPANLQVFRVELLDHQGKVRETSLLSRVVP